MVAASGKLDVEREATKLEQQKAAIEQGKIALAEEKRLMQFEQQKTTLAAEQREVQLERDRLAAHRGAAAEAATEGQHCAAAAEKEGTRNNGIVQYKKECVHVCGTVISLITTLLPSLFHRRKLAKNLIHFHYNNYPHSNVLFALCPMSHAPYM